MVKIYKFKNIEKLESSLAGSLDDKLFIIGDKAHKSDRVDAMAEIF